MKHLRRTVFAALLALLVLGAALPAQAQEAQPLHFDQMVYSRPDLAEFTALAERIHKLLPKAAQAPAVAELFAEAEQLYLHFQTQVQLASLYNSLDVTDTYYSAEAVASYMLLVEAQNMLTELAQEILASPCGRAVAATWEPNMRAFYSYSSSTTEEQMALLSQEQELLQQYLRLAGEELLIEYQGRELSYEQAYASIYTQSAWEEYQELYYQANNARLGALFLELRDLRNALAQSYGFESYIDYAYLGAYGRSYSPQQVKDLLTELEGPIQELYSLFRMAQDYQAMDGFQAALEEWTLAEMAALFAPYFGEVGEGLAESYAYMLAQGLYDFEYSPTKDDGAFVTFLTGYGTPFLFIQPTYAADDLNSLIHESGHFYNYYHNAAAFSGILTTSDLDLEETHARGLEALFIELAGQMFEEPEQVYGMRYFTLLSMLYTVLDATLIGNFELIAYEHPEYTLEQLNQAMYELTARYDSDFFPAARYRYAWADYPHVYQAPLYYISYTGSSLAALELWTVAAEDWQAGRAAYQSLIDNGASDDFLQALRASGLSNPYAPGQLSTLTEKIGGLLQDYGMLYYYDDMIGHWACDNVALAYYYGILAHHTPPFEPDAHPDGLELLGFLGSITSYSGDEYGFRAAVNDLEDFAYDQPLSRQAFLYLLYSMVEEPQTLRLTQPAFADWPEVAAWAQEAVTYLTASGVLTGGEGGMLRPTQPISRAEAVTLLVRFLQS